MAVAVVATEEFVAAVAGKYDFHARCSFARDEQRWNLRTVCKGLVEELRRVFCGDLHDFVRVHAKDDVFGAEMPRDSGGMRGFIKIGVVGADGERERARC